MVLAVMWPLAPRFQCQQGRHDLKIHRIVAATDPGYAVNPQQIEAQVEGSFVYGLSAMLYGECTVKDGRHRAEATSTPTRP